jgi:acyl-CoA dehydrogenase
VPLAAAELRHLDARPGAAAYGSEEQKREHLPKIARGEIRWCQGYSEPNAGSDLASLQTRAEDKGDHFVVNGQKIWTSYADKADWIFCLVRTDRGQKHTGISFLLFDMASAGVSTRPILLISGKSPFCETFFDNVKVPKRNLVGELNAGWDVAKYLLTHEREMISDRRAAAGAARGRRRWRAHRRRCHRPPGRPAAARRDRALRGRRVRLPRCWSARRPGARRQGTRRFRRLLKYYGTELNKRRYELMMAAGGSRRAGMGGRALAATATAPRTWLRTKANSIEGGTSEVQLNIVAKRILGLPGA